MKGLIFLNPQQVSDLAKYDWKPVDKMEKPNVPGQNMGSEGWFQNNEFTQALLGTRFSGAFYFKKDLGTLYFSITSH